MVLEMYTDFKKGKKETWIKMTVVEFKLSGNVS